MLFFKDTKTNFYKENSILEVKNIVNWKRNQNLYNFQILPKTAIITSTTRYITGFKKLFTKKATGLSGTNYILSNNYLLSFGIGNGGPAIISHLEELRNLGVSHFIFIGFAGSLNNNLKENNAYLIKKAYSVSGTSYFYSNSEEQSFVNEYTKILKSKLDLQESICLSTDAPFRETKSMLQYFIEKGCQLIDMETASILAFSKFYKINCACILIASDKIEKMVWSPPKNMSSLTGKIDKIIKKIITI